MKQEGPVTTSMVLAKIEVVRGILAKLREQVCAEPGVGAEIRKHQPQEDALEKIEKDYRAAADAVRVHNEAGTQESAEGLAASQEFLKLASLRNRARKEAGGLVSRMRRAWPVRELGPRVRQRLLRVDEAATYLGLTAHGIRRLVCAGELPSVRVGRFLRLDRADLDAFVMSRRSVEGPTGGPGSRILKSSYRGAEPRNPVEGV